MYVHALLVCDGGVGECMVTCTRRQYTGKSAGAKLGTPGSYSDAIQAQV